VVGDPEPEREPVGDPEPEREPVGETVELIVTLELAVPDGERETAGEAEPLCELVGVTEPLREPDGDAVGVAADVGSATQAAWPTRP